MIGRDSRLLRRGRDCNNYYVYILYTVLTKISCWLSSRTLYIAAVGVAQSLLGSPRNGQAALCLFQKHLLGVNLELHSL
jgi:hypothetical protein